jgi:neutral ceramidase
MNGRNDWARFLVIALTAWMVSGASALGEWKAGASKVNITPTYPVRLSGYGSRTTEHEGVKVDIWAKAMAFAWNGGPPAVVITVDNCGVPASLRAQVLAELGAQGVMDDRLAVCSSHTHCAPMVNGTLKNMFGIDLPADQQERVDRYTNDLRGWMVQAAREAIAKMEPVTLSRGVGQVKFAGNRRYKSPNGLINSPQPGGTDGS